MGLDDLFQTIEKNESDKKQIIELLTRILSDLESITEFNDRELKAISILETDPYFKEYLDFFIQNKKHIKRKHSKEILEALRVIANGLASMGLNNQNSMMGGVFK